MTYGFKMYLVDDHRIKMSYKGITLPGHLTSEWLAGEQGYHQCDGIVHEDKEGKYLEMFLEESKSHYYEFTVRYTNGGGMMSANHPEHYRFFYNAQEALFYAGKELVRLNLVAQEMGVECSASGEIEIRKFCACCHGKGKLGQQKGKRVVKWVHKRCPVCKGKDSEVRVI